MSSELSTAGWSVKGNNSVCRGAAAAAAAGGGGGITRWTENTTQQGGPPPPPPAQYFKYVCNISQVISSITQLTRPSVPHVFNFFFFCLTKSSSTNAKSENCCG